MSAATVFAVSLGCYAAAHQVADYWVQTGGQAARKGLPGWDGRRACAAHVATYTLTLAGFLALAAWLLALPVSPAWAAGGLGVAGLTHYFADRRAPLRKVASLTGKGEFWASGEGLASGAAHLDQAWHIAWIFIAALVTAGGAR